MCFATANRNDIQFIATTTSQGYFANVGSTRRQGLDFAVGGKRAALSWHLVYSFVDATYRSSFEVNGESNSSSDDNGNIMVRAGDRIPLIPRHTGRLALDYCAELGHWEWAPRLIASAGAFCHGNDEHHNQAGGVNGQGDEVSGSGWLSGYTVLNVRSTYHLSAKRRCLSLASPMCSTDAMRPPGFLPATRSTGTDNSTRIIEEFLDQRELSVPSAAARGMGWNAISLEDVVSDLQAVDY